MAKLKDKREKTKEISRKNKRENIVFVDTKKSPNPSCLHNGAWKDIITIVKLYAIH